MSAGAPESVARACPACGASVDPAARFCESCGATLSDAPAPAATAASFEDDAPISAPTRRPGGALPDPPAPGRRPCAECGGEVGPDLYCLQCGTKAPSERDHFSEHPSSWVGGVCDRGRRKQRNEDAMALLSAPEPGSRAVLVVMDGVSNSIDSDVASLAGARAAREVLRLPLPAGMGTPAGRDAAVNAVLARATAAANGAIVAVTDPDSVNPASATLTAVVVEGRRLTWANIGDSRSYWVPDDGEPVQLTVDDSLAQAQIAGGMAREQAESGPQAHAITKWLGRDAEDIAPNVGALDAAGPGWVIACSDGLWNYASEPAELAAHLRAGLAAATEGEDVDPVLLAQHLVDVANAAGGHDNITVALARVGSSSTGHDATLDDGRAVSAPPTDAPPTDPRHAGGHADG
ncbi:PP2C family serine/threonine-protein phosphatase [Nocardioides sp.]|uniref:PP2C family serine/threonine-protein phosphatase n=1 Tax=Nocardioides sp. TaxID=35761 RepID=UPI003513E66A